LNAPIRNSVHPTTFCLSLGSFSANKSPAPAPSIPRVAAISPSSGIGSCTCFILLLLLSHTVDMFHARCVDVLPSHRACHDPDTPKSDSDFQERTPYRTPSQRSWFQKKPAV